MKISEFYKTKKPVLSFEIFPPKNKINLDKLYVTVEKLAELNPDFISVTHGAGGKEKDTLTCEIASRIKNKYGVESVAHLTCINSTQLQLAHAIREISGAGIENVLALRGDTNPELKVGVYKHASDLVAEIKKASTLGIAGACYPEGHVESSNITEDIENLKYKINAGVEVLITQLFFDNAVMYDYRNNLKKHGIMVPVSAGIMPITNVKQIMKTVALSGSYLPPEFTKMIGYYEQDPEGLFDAGIDFAVRQIRDLIEHDIDGVHIYTMNNPKVAKKVYEGIEDLL